MGRALARDLFRAAGLPAAIERGGEKNDGAMGSLKNDDRFSRIRVRV